MYVMMHCFCREWKPSSRGLQCKVVWPLYVLWPPPPAHLKFGINPFPAEPGSVGEILEDMFTIAGKVIAPVYAQLSTLYPQARFLKVDIDEPALERTVTENGIASVVRALSKMPRTFVKRIAVIVQNSYYRTSTCGTSAAVASDMLSRQRLHGALPCSPHLSS